MKRLRYLGTAEEAAFNEDPPPEATQHVDIASASLDSPSDTEMIYEGGLGRVARKRRPAFYNPSGNAVYAYDILSIGRFLRWTLGGYAFTADTPTVGTNLHEIWGSHDNILPSFCARLGKDELDDAVNFEHVFSGCTINSLQLAASDQFAVATADITAAKDSRDDIKAIEDLLLPDSFPLSFVDMFANIDGVEESPIVKSVSIEIANNAAAGEGRSIGSRFPRRIPVGERVVTTTLELYWNSVAQLQKFWGAANGPVESGAVGATEFPLIITLDAGDADNQLVITLPKSWYSQAQQQPSGRGETVQSVTLRSLANTFTLDDAVTEVDSEIMVQLQNVEADLTA